MLSLPTAPAKVQQVQPFYPSSSHPKQPQKPETTGASDFGRSEAGVISLPQYLLPKPLFQRGVGHSCSPDDLLELVFYGCGAALLKKLHYWLLRYEHTYQGRPYVYKSVREWAEELPRYSQPGIRKAIDRLKAAGVLLAEQVQKRDWKQVYWYSINYQRVAELAYEGLKRRYGRFDPEGQMQLLLRIKCSCYSGSNDLQETTSKKLRSKKQQQPAAKKSEQTATDLASVVEVKTSRAEQRQQQTQPQQQTWPPEPELTGGVATNPATTAGQGTGAGTGAPGEMNSNPATPPGLAPNPIQQPRQQTPAVATPAKATDPSSHSDKAGATGNSQNAKQDSGPPADFLVWVEKTLGFTLKPPHRAAMARQWAKSGHTGCENAVLAAREFSDSGRCKNPRGALTTALEKDWEPKEKPRAAANPQTDWLRMAKALGVIKASRSTEAGVMVLTQQDTWEHIEFMQSAFPLALLLRHPDVSQALRVDSWYQLLCQRTGVEPLPVEASSPDYCPPPEHLRLAMQQQAEQHRTAKAEQQAQRAAMPSYEELLARFATAGAA